DKIKSSQEKLFENFDAQVVQKLKTTEKDIKMYISKYEQWLWKITKYLLEGKAKFEDKTLSFDLPDTSEKVHFSFKNVDIEEGIYSLDKKREDAIHYRLGHILAQRLIEEG